MARRKRKPRGRRKSGAFFLLLIAMLATGIIAYQLRRPAEKQTALPQTQPQPTRSLNTPTTASTPQLPVATPATTAPSAATPAAVSSPGDHRLAIIIDDCGQWPQTERALIALPIPITMSVMPKERYTQAIAQEASAAGKGVMLHLPMEPIAALDPGPGKITTAMTDKEIVAQVKDDIADVPLAKGVNNHEGSKASADPRVMRDVVSVLAQGGLFFIDSRTSAQSVGAQIAAEGGIPTASRDVFLDNQDNLDAVETMLRSAADVALKSGSAIAIGHPRAATLEALRALIPELQAHGITFTLASDLVRSR